MNRRQFFFTALPVALAAQSTSQRPSAELRPATPSARNAAIQALRAQPEAAEQLQMLQDEGSPADLAAAQVLTAPGGTVTVIPLRSAKGQARMIVESAAPGRAPFIYYDGDAATPPPKPLALFGCSSWSAWAQDGASYCKQTIYRCLAKQQSTFIRYKRTKTCRNSIKLDYKVVRQHCGC